MIVKIKTKIKTASKATSLKHWHKCVISGMTTSRQNRFKKYKISYSSSSWYFVKPTCLSRRIIHLKISYLMLMYFRILMCCLIWGLLSLIKSNLLFFWHCFLRRYGGKILYNPLVHSKVGYAS